MVINRWQDKFCLWAADSFTTGELSFVFKIPPCKQFSNFHFCSLPPSIGPDTCFQLPATWVTFIYPSLKIKISFPIKLSSLLNPSFKKTVCFFFCLQVLALNGSKTYSQSDVVQTQESPLILPLSSKTSNMQDLQFHPPR